MAKAAKKSQTSNGGSSSQKRKNGNAKKGKTEDADKAQPSDSKIAADASAEEPKEKKRRGRAPTEGEPLKRVLIFLSDDDISALKAEVGDRGMSTRIREILREYLAKRA